MPLFGYKKSAPTPLDEIVALRERHNSNAATQDYLGDRAKRLAIELRQVQDEYNEISVIAQTKIDELYNIQAEAEDAAYEAGSKADDIHYAATS